MPSSSPASANTNCRPDPSAPHAHTAAGPLPTPARERTPRAHPAPRSKHLARRSARVAGAGTACSAHGARGTRMKRPLSRAAGARGCTAATRGAREGLRRGACRAGGGSGSRARRDERGYLRGGCYKRLLRRALAGARARGRCCRWRHAGAARRGLCWTRGGLGGGVSE